VDIETPPYNFLKRRLTLTIDAYVCAIADLHARDTGLLTFIGAHDGVRDLFWLSSGPVFYHFTFTVVNREKKP
jgi:hypothetical protein